MTDLDLQLTDYIDVSILMHRETHFSGSFNHMIDYYQKEGRGVQPDFNLEKIQALAEMEKKSGENLAVLLLSGADAEKIAQSKRLYKNLRDLYDEDEEKEGLRYALLIADLILTEDPEAKDEIAAIIKEKEAIVPALIEILKAPDFYDTLFPGYGQSPEFAIQCLGQIGDKRAIMTLFEQIGRSDFFNEDLAIEGLKQIGPPAKEFLQNVLKSNPVTEDNERAAIALASFKSDPDISHTALKMLQEPEVRQELPLANYLAFICEGLVDETDKKQFVALANNPTTPKAVCGDIKQIAKNWR